MSLQQIRSVVGHLVNSTHNELLVIKGEIIDRQVRFSLTPEESFECVFKPDQAHYELIKAFVLARARTKD